MGDRLSWEESVKFRDSADASPRPALRRQESSVVEDGAARPTYKRQRHRLSLVVPRMPLAAFLGLLRRPPAPLGDAAFEALYGYGYDACLVVASGRDPAPTLRRVAAGGVEARVVRSTASRLGSTRRRYDACLVLLRVGVPRLVRAADDLDWPVPLDGRAVERAIRAGAPGIAPRSLRHDPAATRGLRPYESVYARYDTDVSLQRLYASPRGCSHLFEWPVLRLKLLYEILEAPARAGGCGLRLRSAPADGDVEACFPLHDDRRRRELWRRFRVSAPRLDALRSYLGERLALYFAFLHSFASWCAASAVAGALATAALYGESRAGRRRAHSRALPAFAFFQCIWAILWLENWKRRQARLALRWGTLGLEETAPDRPTFSGDSRTSLVDGAPGTFFPAATRRGRMAAGGAVVALLAALATAAAGSVIAFRVALKRRFAREIYASGLASVLNALQIEVLNVAFARVAARLNAWENHRSDQAFLDNLALKLIAFFLCNYNVPLVYAAFFQRRYEGCPRSGDRAHAPGRGTCLKVLEANLGIIFVTKLLANLFAEAARPRAEGWLERARRRRRRAASEVDDAAAAAEDQYGLAVADDVDDHVADMTTLAVRFSFITLFVGATPSLAALCWFANHVEASVDLHKFLFFKRRQWPKAAACIGSWLVIFQAVAVGAVFTSSAVLFYTVEWEPRPRHPLSAPQRAWAFFLAQYAVFALMAALALAIPDLPDDVEIQMRRQRFLVAKLVDRTPDEPDDDEEGGEADEANPLLAAVVEPPPPPPLKRRSASQRVFDDLVDREGRLEGKALAHVLSHRTGRRRGDPDVGALVAAYEAQPAPHTLRNFRILLKRASSLRAIDAICAREAGRAEEKVAEADEALEDIDLDDLDSEDSDESDAADAPPAPPSPARNDPKPSPRRKPPTPTPPRRSDPVPSPFRKYPASPASPASPLRNDPAPPVYAPPRTPSSHPEVYDDAQHHRRIHEVFDLLLSPTPRSRRGVLDSPAAASPRHRRSRAERERAAVDALYAAGFPPEPPDG